MWTQLVGVFLVIFGTSANQYSYSTGPMLTQDCQLGLEDAKAGLSCTSSANNSVLETRKNCCMGCKIGLISAKGGMDCSYKPTTTSSTFSNDWNTALAACCERATHKPSAVQIPADNMCERYPRQLCQHVCEPIGSSGYRCECYMGFTLAKDDKSCVRNASDTSGRRLTCQDDYCEQICEESHPSVKCSCQVGYQLGPDGQSCFDVDECVVELNPCLVNSVCHNTAGSFTCEANKLLNTVVDLTGNTVAANICPTGFRYNLLKQDCVDVDECLEETHNCVTGQCVNTQGSFSCHSVVSCPAGYKRNGLNGNCKDVDECSEDLHDCKPKEETCRNTIGAYECDLVCPDGMRFNAIAASCLDVDECTERTHHCEAKEECINNIGSFYCVPVLTGPRVPHCDPGFAYDGLLEKCVDIDECATADDESDICPGGLDQCVNTVGSFFCLEQQTATTRNEATCRAGYRFERVDGKCVDVDECINRTSPCPKDETCVNLPGGFVCEVKLQCGVGLELNSAGTSCIDVDECKIGYQNACSLGTKCINTYGSYVCHCSTTATAVTPSDYSCPTGTVFSFVSNKCISVYGSTRGRQVVCPQGQTFNSLLNICEKQDNPELCNGFLCRHGNCVVQNSKPICVCHQGFQMDVKTMTCEDVNECQLNSDMCLPSQRCDNTIGSYSCIRVTNCGTGYTLNSARNACEDDDECTLGTAGCEELGPGWQCENTQGSFRCAKKTCSTPGQQLNETTGVCSSSFTSSTKECGVGYRRRHARVYGSSSVTVVTEDCEDIDECAQYGVCPPAQVCINTLGSFKCEYMLKCGSGFKINPSGTYCDDVDECQEGTHKCKSDEVCGNTPGSYTCDCPQGFEKKYSTSVNNTIEYKCEDVDECHSYGRYQTCSRSAECENSVGSYMCTCKAGFKQAEDGRTCVDRDECNEVGNACQQKCVNIWGSYHCTCNSGYKLNPDKRSCTDIDECDEYKARGTSLCIGMCVNTPGSYKCDCPQGYQLSADGRRCEDINECHNEPCKEEQICSNAPGSHRCHDVRCPMGYIRDSGRRNRCKLDTVTICPRDDTACLKKPWSYSFNFLSLRANARIPSTSEGVDLFTMTGPRDGNIDVHFSLELVSARAPPHVQAATRLHFRLKQNRRNEASVSLVRSLGGPQEVELELRMDVVSDRSYGGAAVAKILVYVSQFDY